MNHLNILLFDPTEVELPLLRNDARAIHIIDILRLQAGETFDAGVINGPRGKGTLVAINDASLRLFFVWGNPPPPPYPIHLLIGLPRPQTARDILRDLTTLGVASINFIQSERGEASYAQSNLWKSDEWRKCVINGATQAFCTQLPAINHPKNLADAIANLPKNASKIMLDNYEASQSLSACHPVSPEPVILAIGSERGWSPGERLQLQKATFQFAHLGPRVLRTETACIAAVTLIRSKLGLF